MKLFILWKGQFMNKYIMIGKLSIEFSSSMVGKPQNRTEIVTPFFENLGGKLIQMLYINHPEMNAIAYIEAPNDEAVASMAGIVKASGMFDDLNWYRAFDAGELQKIYEFASDKMNEYVSAKAFTENL
tara:strand:- start:1589 stop:1972 length:384 start_codon:yes stop_codon:yes gene_type:complete